MLNENDKIIAHVSSAIAVYSIRSSNGMLTNDISMIDFILKTTPKNLEAKVSIDLIDDVFSYISGTHFDT
ncbi:MAG TPA: hypothetical protein QGF01_04315 [Candidatus Nitrosopelagicus sp.]|jgi:hypothetical protein|nr:hypothetical protein [Nitrosopumilales archaeon]MDP7285226.1 hypothetical protein [Candidatus Nitrosopelagicus sp.]HJN20148.1 hypothetical protein [Candidatus Nitrosopelagicus sp.]